MKMGWLEKDYGGPNEGSIVRALDLREDKRGDDE
jgi:hypothetical protein